jgi:hypothetical protein
MKHLPLRAIAMVMIVLAGAACGTGSPSGTPTPAVAIPSMDPSLSSALVAAPAPSGATTERVDLVRQSGDSAVIVASTEGAQPAGEGDVLLAVRDSSGWRLVTRADTSAFCAALARAPADVMPDAWRSYFGECR